MYDRRLSLLLDQVIVHLERATHPEDIATLNMIKTMLEKRIPPKVAADQKRDYDG